MRHLSQIKIGPFVLDHSTRRLLKDGAELHLRPKTFEVLALLIEAGGNTVSKEDLLQSVWPGVYVSDTVLKVCIRELRQVFEEDARNPRFIGTVHSHGYRFLAPAGDEPKLGPDFEEALASTELAPGKPSETSRPFVGRTAELTRILAMFGGACSGQRKAMFVVAGSGAGKSWLADAFLRAVAASSKKYGKVWVLRGQCLAQHGVSEAYQPILDAITRLDAYMPPNVLAEQLAKHAPSLLLQLPALQRPGDTERLTKQTLGTSTERIARETIAFFEALARATPVLLAIDDLHFADEATLDLVGALCRRSDPARLCLLLLCRPNTPDHRNSSLAKVKQELLAYAHCTELTLGPLQHSDVQGYLEALFPKAYFLSPLADRLFASTKGHPLFLALQVESLILEGLLFQEPGEGEWRCQEGCLDKPLEVAESIRSLILGQAEALPTAEFSVLEAMSVAGEHFTAENGSAMLAWSAVEVEAVGERLSRHSLFVARESMREAGGERAIYYRFRHGLQQNTLYEHMAPQRRAALHLRLAEKLEQRASQDLEAMTAPLALHFEQGRAPRRAAQWLLQLSRIDVRRFSGQTANEHLKRAIELLSREARDKSLTLELEIYSLRSHLAGQSGDIHGAIQAMLQLREISKEAEAIEVEVRALHELLMYHWQDAPQAVALAKEALWRAEQGASEATRTVAQGYLELCRALLHRCAPEDKAAAEAGLQASEQVGSLWTKLGYHGLFMTVYLNGDPATAGKIALEMKADALSLGVQGHYFGAAIGELIALYRLSQWQGLHARFSELREEARRQDYALGLFNIRLVQGMYCFEARAFDAVLTLDEANLEAMRGMLPEAHSQYLMVRIARCRLELGDTAQAKELFARISPPEDSFFWYLADAFVLESSVEFALHDGDFQRADRYLQMLYERAWGYMDGDWLLRHHTLKLKLLAQQKCWTEAEEETETVLPGQLETWPVAAWNFHEMAARILFHTEKRKEALRHLQLRNRIIDMLLEQVADDAEVVASLSKIRSGPPKAWQD